MKKILYSLLCVASILGAISCASDDFGTSGDATKVTFTANLEGQLGSRAYGDGTTVDKLVFMAYDEEGNIVPGLTQTDVSISGNRATVNVQLVAGKTYDFAFFAYNKSGNYYDVSDLKAIKVKNPTSYKGNEESRDAFSASIVGFKVNGSVSKEVVLKRPFAQINVLTKDLSKALKAGFATKAKVSMTIKNVCDTYNVVNGEASGSNDVNVKKNVISDGENIIVGGVNYDSESYLAMNYILVPAKTSLIDCHVEIDDNNDKKVAIFDVPNAPVQANYRTNILGNFFTNPGQFDIVIDSEFESGSSVSSIEVKSVKEANSLLQNKCTAPIIIAGTDYVPTSDETIAFPTDGTPAKVIFKGYNSSFGLNISGNGTLVLEGATIAPAYTGTPAVTIASNSNVKMEITGSTRLYGALGGDGIEVNGGSILDISGEGSLLAEGNAGVEYFDNKYWAGDKNKNYAGYAGSGIGNAGGQVGDIYIHDLKGLTAIGYGLHAYGIGGNAKTVSIKNTKISLAQGGMISDGYPENQNTVYSDPEGGAGIGANEGQIIMDNVQADNIIGGSKASGIGCEFWKSVSININNCSLSSVIGGHTSAGIGGSRYRNEDTQKATIVINNSNITAVGGWFGAGIGSGYDSNCLYRSDACEIHIKGNSNIIAKGGRYASGIGTGFHVGSLRGEIESTVNGVAYRGDVYSYKSTYTNAQNIGYGVVDPAREFKNPSVTFKVSGNVIVSPL